MQVIGSKNYFNFRTFVSYFMFKVFITIFKIRYRIMLSSTFTRHFWGNINEDAPKKMS